MAARIDSSIHQSGHYIVVGLGVSGTACVDYLLQQGLPVQACDTRDEPPGLKALLARWPQLMVTLGELNLETLQQADVLVVSPGLSLKTPLFERLREAGVRIIGEIELFAEALAHDPQQQSAYLIGVTGSNGKSTVTTLLGEMAEHNGIKVAVGGNLGTPALQLLQQQADCYVLELSSFQLESCPSLCADIGIVLNLSADHMDRYDSLDDYRATKQRLQQQSKRVVADRSETALWPAGEVIGYDLSRPQNPDEFGLGSHHGEAWLMHGERPCLALKRMKLASRSQIRNALAALSIGQAAGWTLAAMLAAIEGFSGLPHRAEWLGEAAGISWINDSKGTNPGATAAALDGLLQSVLLIAGGQSKAADMGVLRPQLQAQVKRVLLIGEDAELLQQAWQDVVPCEQCGTLERAVLRAAELAVAGEVVMLSPACASFDQFTGFAERGERFTALALEMMARSQGGAHG